jgi:4-carboxymuconolactone decarboxylase
MSDDARRGGDDAHAGAAGSQSARRDAADGQAWAAGSTASQALEARLERGHAKGREMLGDRWDRIVEAVAAAGPDFARYVTEFAYGEVYCRPGLDMRSREMIAVTCLTLQGLKPQLKTHLMAALQVGVTEEELQELFIHMALYAGFPTALFGLQTAKEVLDERAG